MKMIKVSKIRTMLIINLVFLPNWGLNHNNGSANGPITMKDITNQFVLKYHFMAGFFSIGSKNSPQ